MTTEEQRLESYRRTIAIIAVAATLLVAFMIIRPFVLAIIFAMVLAYLFYPLYKYLMNYVPKPLPKQSIASFLCVLLAILIIVIPLTIITIVMAREIRDGYDYLQRVVGFHNAAKSQVPAFPSFYIFDIPLWGKYNIDITQLREPVLEVMRQVLHWIQGVLVKLPNVFFSVFITIFSMYFFLKNSSDIMNFIRDFFPLPKGRYKQIFQRFDDLSRGMINGQIVVGAIQGFLAWIGYVFLGVPNPVLWAVLTAVISIIPLLGAAIVWFPVSVYLFALGYFTDGSWWKGVALLIYGAVLISTIDNVLKPKIVGDRAKIHPLIIFFGILGGIQLFGIPGILLGPLFLTILDVVLSIYREVV